MVLNQNLVRKLLFDIKFGMFTKEQPFPPKQESCLYLLRKELVPFNKRLYKIWKIIFVRSKAIASFYSQ